MKKIVTNSNYHYSTFFYIIQQVSGYKRPKNVVIAKEHFPRTATSKIKRKEVKQIYAGQ